MGKLILKWAVLITVVSLMSIGCKKDDEKPVQVEENGLTVDINNLVPDSILNEMKNLGMPINTGGNPPNIENSYLVTPFVLLNSNRPSDNIGTTFADYKVKFHDQDNENLKISVDFVNGPESGNGIGAFIVGDDNEFSIFAEMVARRSNLDSASFVNVISGKIVEGGVENLYYANFMLDNNGNSNGIWIENGEGRVLYDKDGFSEEIEFDEKTSTNYKSAISAALSKK